jgi:hypothetical protein
VVIVLDRGRTVRYVALAETGDAGLREAMRRLRQEAPTAREVTDFIFTWSGPEAQVPVTEYELHYRRPTQELIYTVWPPGQTGERRTYAPVTPEMLGALSEEELDPASLIRYGAQETLVFVPAR